MNPEESDFKTNSVSGNLMKFLFFIPCDQKIAAETLKLSRQLFKIILNELYMLSSLSLRRPYLGIYRDCCFIRFRESKKTTTIIWKNILL